MVVEFVGGADVDFVGGGAVEFFAAFFDVEGVAGGAVGGEKLFGGFAGDV